ncbi:antitoxin component of RelBE/YafQ-DinJ toxin-antitoxin module [Metapseudomonas resinovorans]
MKEEYSFSGAKRGAVAPTRGKTRITIMIDDAVLEAARERADKQGIGYQTLINSVLKRELLEQVSPQEDKASEAKAVSLLDLEARLKALEGIISATRPNAIFKAMHPRNPKILLYDFENYFTTVTSHMEKELAPDAVIVTGNEASHVQHEVIFKETPRRPRNLRSGRSKPTTE